MMVDSMANLAGVLNPYADIGPPLPMVPREPIPVPPPDFSKKEQEIITEYANDWLAHSYAYTAAKLPTWRLVEDLYRSRRPLSLWDSSITRVSKEQLRAAREDWKSQMVTSLKPSVDSFVMQTYAAIFSAEEYLRVLSEPDPEKPNIEDPEWSTEEKIAAMLLHDLGQGHFRPEVARALLYMALFGPMLGKTVWVSKKMARWYDYGMGPEATLETLYQGPRLRIVKPHDMLVDWSATNCNIQEWRGCGDLGVTDWLTVNRLFDDGAYHLNRAEATKRWKDAEGDDSLSDREEVMEDQDRLVSTTYGVPGEYTGIRRWEYHGELPTKTGWQEGFLTVLTDSRSDSPEGGVLVRLRRGPAYQSGMRPYVMAHLYHVGEPFGQSLVEPHLEALYHISKLNAMIVNTAVLIAQPESKVLRGSAAARGLVDDPNRIPGRVHQVDDMNELMPVEPPKADWQLLAQRIDHAEIGLESALPSRNPPSIMGKADLTATQSAGLMSAMNSPIQNHIQWIKESFLDPFGTIALGLIQEQTEEGRNIPITGPDGRPTYVPVTAEEIRTGKYRVDFITSNQDHMRIAKAQAKERMIGLLTAPNTMQALQMEGKVPQISQIIVEWGRDLDNRRPKEMLRDLPPPPPMMPGAPPGGPGEEISPEMLLAAGFDPNATEPEGGGGVSPQAEGPGETGGGPLGRRGGPMGAEPTQDNLFAQLLQENARQQAQPPPGVSR